MSQSDDASTARLDTSLIAITSSSPRCISPTVWVTGPPSNTRAAPCVRLVSPEVTAASWSTRSGGNPLENGRGKASAETTIAWATDGTRSTKFVISQFRSWTGRASGLTRPPLCMASSVTTSLTARGRRNLSAHYEALSPSSPSGVSPPCADARASRTPRWKLARRSLVCAADLDGAGGAGEVPPTPPGTRFALGTRLGSPTAVVPPETGACATSAASQPASAGEGQSPETAPLAARATGRSAPCPPRRNQSDSTDSEVGSRLASPQGTAGRTITPFFAGVLASERRVATPRS